MIQLPALQTQRLILRAFTLADASRVQELAGERDVAKMTYLLPHPYPAGLAETWIGSHAENLKKDKEAIFALVEKATQTLIGSMGLRLVREHEKAEVGFWIGKPYWGKGYATEALRAVIEFGFKELKLNRIFGLHFGENPASGRVMEKVGMKYEGCLRQHIKKWGTFQDAKIYAVLANEIRGCAKEE